MERLENAHLMVPANGMPDGIRPMLKPEPDFVAGSEMLTMLRRKSPWALGEDEADYGIAYAMTTDPEMREFGEFVTAAMEANYLPTYAKCDDGALRLVAPETLREIDAIHAILTGGKVTVGIITPNAKTAFNSLASTHEGDGELWFRVRDVNNLDCSAEAVAHVASEHARLFKADDVPSEPEMPPAKKADNSGPDTATNAAAFKPAISEPTGRPPKYPEIIKALQHVLYSEIGIENFKGDDDLISRTKQFCDLNNIGCLNVSEDTWERYAKDLTTGALEMERMDRRRKAEERNAVHKRA